MIPLPRTSAVMVMFKRPLAGQPALQGRADVALDLRLERAGGRRQVDRQRDGAVADPDVLDHPQVDQVAAEVGVLDPFKASSTSRSVSVELVLPNIEPDSSAGGTTLSVAVTEVHGLPEYSIPDSRKGPVGLVTGRARKSPCVPNRRTARSRSQLGFILA